MISVAEMENSLGGILDRWIQLNIDAKATEAEWLRAHGANVPEEVEENGLKLIMDMAREAEPHLAAFLRDNSDRSAEELEELADKLSPGGAHTGGLLVRLIQANVWAADPLLLAATIRYNWHGGKAGFQFLPDPAETDFDAYEEEAMGLLDLFDQAIEGDARRILTGDDRAFFDSLPDRFTIYRGCAGVSIEHAAAGVCWTTQRAVAEWFAVRSAGFADAEPILITARITKADVRLVKASEFEVVTKPRRYRALQCRRRRRSDWRPAMTWKQADAKEMFK